MIRNVIKFTSLGILFVALASAIIYGIGYWKYQNSPEYRAEQNLKKLEKKYAEDPYGGETPEETLRLFVDALKKEDTELAAKYFVLDKQEQWREDLARLQERNLLGEMVKDLERVERGKDIDSKNARFIVSNKNKEVITIINISENTNGKWKLLDF